MHCHDARHLLDKGVDPGAAETIRTLLGFHLAGCPECRAYRRQRDDERLLGELMARQPEARRPTLRPRRRALGIRTAGSAALVCGALLVSAGMRPAAAAPAAAPAPRYAPGYETARSLAYAVPAAPVAASREHTVYVALALAGENAASPAAMVAQAPLSIAPKAELPVAAAHASMPQADILAETPLVAGQELIIPALPVNAPAAQPAPQRSYTVRAGDTLSGIAYSYYGDWSLWRVIWDANRESIRDPNLIFPGQTFLIPAILGQNPPVISGPGSQQGAGGIYVVQPGDNLSAIAERAYGNASAWQTIYSVNRSVIGANPNLILPGQQLQLPR